MILCSSIIIDAHDLNWPEVMHCHGECPGDSWSHACGETHHHGDSPRLYLMLKNFVCLS